VNIEQALQQLYARVPRGMRLGLDAMREACAAMGHPEAAFEAVHVAGTNGKGSVCAMVESIARASGKPTGLYTSPHLCRFAERIRIDGEPIADDKLADLLTRVLAAAPELSFFETATLAAFVAFREAKVDLGVVEVGIGGRLDATNVIAKPRVSAITRIAFDHMDKLGATLVEIAREKAGIAKAGVPIVLGPIEGDVRDAIDVVARDNGASTVPSQGDDAYNFFFGATGMPLMGLHQSDNEVVAFRIVRLLGIANDAIDRGMRATKWPGRLERIQAADGPYLLDGAHNPDGAAALAKYLTPWPRDLAHKAPFSFYGYEPLALVFGTLADKAWPEMLDALAPCTPHRVYVSPQGRAATPPAELAARHPGLLAASAEEARTLARGLLGPEGLVVVCGSIYLVGEVRALLLGLPRDPPVAL
jgi:dihydrofolate synthase/folylpolyglutamate synthase